MLKDKGWLKPSTTLLEPCVGNGALLKSISNPSTTYDIAPHYKGAIQQDYLLAPITKHQLVFTNPPFGRNSSLAVKFFNRACLDSDRVAFIVPQSFRKTTIIDRLDEWFHPVFDADLPDQHFILPNGDKRLVKTCFQLWSRRHYKRNLFKSFVTPDLFFQKVKSPVDADFALRTQGSSAGLVLKDLLNTDGSTFSPGTTAYIKGDKSLFTQHDWTTIASFTSAIPAIGLQDIRLGLLIGDEQRDVFLRGGAAQLLIKYNSYYEQTNSL